MMVFLVGFEPTIINYGLKALTAWLHERSNPRPSRPAVGIGSECRPGSEETGRTGVVQSQTIEARQRQA